MDHGDDLRSILVIIPTFNERENLSSVTSRVRAAVPYAHLLVVDDDSPDGTGALADELAAADERFHVLHRAAKDGLGAAYLAGFAWAIDRGFDVMVEMDADGSHQPEQLPSLLAALDDADLVIGARWVPGGRVENWPKHRELLSRAANTYARLLLGIPLHDATGGYRAFRRETLEELDLEGVISRGYCFQIDLALRTLRQDMRITEIPITFVERQHGNSKMSQSVIFEAMFRVAQWGIRDRLQTLRRSRPAT